MAYAVALDPGGTTGVCLVQSGNNPWNITVFHLEGEHHRILLRFLLATKPEFIICESFENQGNLGALLKPCEYIGIVKLYAQDTIGVKGVWQSASTGKGFFSDDRLKQIGLYADGLKHARDATKHYLYWRCFTQKDHSILRGPTKGKVQRLPNLPH